jgi:hypothetical protein
MLRDLMGQEMKVNDRVVYGASLGRCAAVGVGLVVQLKENTNDEIFHEPMQVLIAPERTQFYDVKNGCEPGWSNNPLKPRWFKFSERMVILNRSNPRR